MFYAKNASFSAGSTAAVCLVPTPLPNTYLTVTIRLEVNATASS